VVAIDISDERLELAKQYGADATINASDPGMNVIEALKELSNGEGMDKTLDCTGMADARIQAVRSTRTWGTTCFVGEGNDVTIDVSPDMLRRQLTLIGSWTFSSIGQEECAKFCAERGIPVDSLFTQRYKMEEAVEAYELFDTQTTGKGVFML